MSTPTEAPKSLQPNQALLAGKIIEVNALEQGGYATVIAQPARDEYQLPGRVNVISARRLGNKDDVVRVLVECSGYGQRVNGSKGQWTKTINVYRAAE
ncbi:hypothetical protein ACEPMY_01270 [Ralstonia pseudosolanacearum]|uniref:hypothetical protein n=1 Tax=Ralstonia pseudosolanacearum TaxID=1310165 RepID=UPI0038672305